MKLSLNFKKMEHTDAIDDKIREKSEKLKKFFHGNLNVEWHCYIDDKRNHVAELNVKGPSFHYHSKAKSDSLYKSIDQGVQKVLKQLEKKKSKWRDDHYNNEAIRPRQIEESLKDEEFWEDRDPSSEDVA